jgi:hypothetical protein
MIRHTCNTWLLANLIHPLIWIIYVWITLHDAMFAIQLDTVIGQYVTILIFSLIASSPLLALGCVFIRIVTQPRYTIPAAWSLWLVTLILLVVFEAIVMVFFFGDLIFEMYEIFLPSIIATCLAVCIRYKQFTRLYYSPETNEHENDMV